MSYMDDVKEQFLHFKKSLCIYWATYGGFKSLIASPYLFIALLISMACAPYWASERVNTWHALSLLTLPNLLGFTLGGYAMLIAFGDEKFRNLISGSTKGKISPFMALNGAFVHFVIVQVVALSIALFGSAWSLNTGCIAFIGFTCFVYSLLTAVAAVLAVLRVAGWFDHWCEKNNSAPKQ
ncbi:MAG: hypothetical protein B6I36_02310 [Desulfobacteraceae bacterium 4572_35.1]|nr:MAG: hypothetical protein B6I36_02310 [Desulfobacteraceae bacterium 4572_35.1]